MDEMTEKVVMITGANGGLGTCVTDAFLKAGTTVVGVARSIQPSAFANPRFIALAADLVQQNSTQTMVDTVAARLEKIDILVHVMGGFAGGELVENTTDDVWDRMMNLNVRSAFNVLRAVVPTMRKAKRGRVIAIGARSAVEPKAYLGAYCASKAALAALIRTVALEGREDGITANLILPGTMDTPANRAADPSADTSNWVPPSRVASLALWLASDEASQISGALIPAYGKGL